MVSGGLPGCTCSFCICWHHSAACSIGNWFPGLSAAANHCIASICAWSFAFELPFIVFVRSWTAVMTKSLAETSGCVMYLCLKHTVSEIRLALVALTKIQ